MEITVPEIIQAWYIFALVAAYCGIGISIIVTLIVFLKLVSKGIEFFKHHLD